MVRYEPLCWVGALLLSACSSPRIELGGGRPGPTDDRSEDAGGSDAAVSPAPVDGGASGAPTEADAAEPMAADLDGGALPDAEPIDARVPLGEPPDQSCTGRVFDGHVYWFCTDGRDWGSAREDCQAVGGDLVSVQSSEEQAFLDQYAGTGQWILGVHDVDGVFVWADGSALTYTNWAPNEPDSLDCSIIEDGLWRTWLCLNNEDWICEL